MRASGTPVIVTGGRAVPPQSCRIIWARGECRTSLFGLRGLLLCELHQFPQDNPRRS